MNLKFPMDFGGGKLLAFRLIFRYCFFWPMENGRQLDSRLNQEKGMQQENMRLHVCWPALGLLDSTVLIFVGRPFEKILLHHHACDLGFSFPLSFSNLCRALLSRDRNYGQHVIHLFDLCAVDCGFYARRD